MKIINSSNNIDVWTRLETLLGLKQSRHTDTLRERTNLIDKLHKRIEVQNKQQDRKALDKFFYYSKRFTN